MLWLCCGHHGGSVEVMVAVNVSILVEVGAILHGFLYQQ